MSVYGTVTRMISLQRVFSAVGSDQFPPFDGRPIRHSELRARICQRPSPWLRPQSNTGPAIPSASLLAQTPYWQYRNINRLSIAYAFQPRLRHRLTLGGLTFPRKPWAFGERVFHPFYRYSCRHHSLLVVQRRLRHDFAPTTERSPTYSLAVNANEVLQLRYYALAPIYFRRKTHSTGELLRTL